MSDFKTSLAPGDTIVVSGSDLKVGPTSATSLDTATPLDLNGPSPAGQKQTSPTR